MPLDAGKIKQINALLAPGSGITDEQRTQLLAARDSYQDESLNASMQLDSQFSLMPQALAVQPGTTHPGGDKVAEEEWRVNPAEASRGQVFVYDVPLEVAKKQLLENPGKLRALYPNLDPTDPSLTPEGILAMQHDSPVYKDFNERTWRDTAEAAAGSGRTAIRYNKAPWLQGGKADSILGTLSTKVKGAAMPATEGAEAFVMGVDDMGAFGAGRAMQEALPPSITNAAPANPTLGSGEEPSDLVLGGVQETDAKKRNAQVEEEHPYAYAGGQALAALSGWGPANYLWGKALGAAGSAAKAVGGGPAAQLAARLGFGTAAGAAAAGAQRGVNDLVDIGADAVQGDESGLPLEAVPGRMVEAAVTALPFAGLGAAAGEYVAKKTHDARWGNRYKGGVGQLEEDVPDMKFSPFGGPRSQSMEDLKVRARKARAEPQDLINREIAPPIAKVLDEDVRGAFEAVEKKQQAYYPTGEGEMKLPVRNLTEKAVEKMRADMEAVTEGGVPRPIGTPDAGGEVKAIFNEELESVSTRPLEGGVPLTPEEAEAFLSPGRQRDLRESFKAQPPPKRTETLPSGPSALSPPDKLTTGGPVSRRPGPVEPPVNIPETLATTPSKREPKQSDAATRTFGQKESLTGKKAAVPEPKKGAVRVSGPGRAQAAAEEPTTLAAQLRAKGVDRVYVVPRRHNALHHESLLKKIEGYREANPSNKDLMDLDKAARVDRDARPMNGEVGGWSRLQAEHSALIEQRKLAEKLGAPGGDSFKVLTSYTRARPGELPKADVLRDAASRAGVREQLDQARSLNPYEDLRKQSSFESRADGTRAGKLKSTGDFASVRAFPVLRALEGPLGPISGGQGGKVANMGRDEDEKERRKDRLRKEASK